MHKRYNHSIVPSFSTMSRVPPELRALAPNIDQSAQFYCDNVTCTAAYTRCPTVGELDDTDYDWCIKLQCSVCNSVWWLCNSCNMRKKITARCNIKRHHYSNHGTSMSESNKRGRSKRDAIVRKKTITKGTKGSSVATSSVANTRKTIIPPFEYDEGNCEHGSVFNVEVADDQSEFYSNKSVATTDRSKPKAPSSSNFPSKLPLSTRSPSSKTMDPPSSRSLASPPTKHPSRVNTSPNNCENMSPLKSPTTTSRTVASFGVPEKSGNIFNTKDVVITKTKTNVLELLLRNNDIHKINDNMLQFYSHDLISSGKKYLITKMCNKEDRNANDIFGNISNDEVECQIRISDFVRTLTRNQKMDFADVVSAIDKSYIQNKTMTLCKLPGTFADIRRLYVDGVDSVTNNLPIPTIKQLHKHSYISIMDCIADFLLSNKRQLKLLEDYELSINQEKDLSLFHTERTKEIIKEANVRRTNTKENGKIIVLLLKIWSDDFDPNSSIKSNRGSVWVKTATIFAMTVDGSKVSYTYALATSAKGVDHEEVEVRICHELELLRFGKMKPFYCRFLSAPVMVHSDVFCVMTDQPERRSTLGLAAGNSRQHKRFGYLFDCVNSIDVIRSCPTCTTEVLRLVQLPDVRHIKACNECTCWLMFPDSTLLAYTPDNLFPESKLDDDGKLMPKKITKLNLENAIEDVTLAIQRKIWSTNNCKSYLRNEGFNQNAIDEITECALNSMTYRDARKQKHIDPEHWSTISCDHSIDPTRYEQWSLPSSWYFSTDTDLYVDVPMHLLLLGVAKSVYIKISKWLRLKMQLTQFKALTLGVLENITKYTLDWCKVLKYPNTSSDKFGGWVAENFLGFVRLSPWFYTLLHLLREPKEKPNLDIPRTAWRVKENKYWLELRGLDNSGKAPALKQRVREYMEMEEPPPIIDNDQVSVGDIMDLVSALHEMIATLLQMKNDYNVIDSVELVIRKFLIYYDKVDIGMGKKDSPTWMTQYNFLCLLNLPNVMRKYGFVRNLWEGGVEGEGFLRNYKREMKNGLQPNWQMWTIRNLMQRTVFSKEKMENTYHWRERLTDECRIYKSEALITTILNDNNPLSAIIDDNYDVLFILFRRKKEIIGIPVEIDWDHPHDTLHGKTYYHIDLDDERRIVIDDDVGNRAVSCLLLPRLVATIQQTYCVVFSDWRINY